MAIYKFKKWVILPAYTEIIISADNDQEALKIMNAIDPKTLNWQETDAVDQRMTYEVIDEKSRNLDFLELSLRKQLKMQCMKDKIDIKL